MNSYRRVRRTITFWDISETHTIKTFPLEDHLEASGKAIWHISFWINVYLGEGALQALRGSAIGFGSDIGEL